jgi:uncharacterized protein with FMN-binding domain
VVTTPMRQRVIVVMTAGTAVVIALSLRASAQGRDTTSAPAQVGIVETAPKGATRTPSPSPSPTAKPRATSGTATVNGDIIDTMYGPVQVQVIVRGNRIVSAHGIDYPQGGGRDQEINSQAIPQLDHETMQAQSARIDTVSGATYTSKGYRRSLQSALDAAHQAA